MADKLDELIVDEQQKPNFDILAEILNPYVRLSRDGNVLFEKNYMTLPQWKKIILYLLGRKALFNKGLISEEAVKPNEIGEKIGAIPKSVSKFFAVELKGIALSKTGKYIIPNYNLQKCQKLLNSK